MTKILIVDDDAELRRTVSDILSGAGYSTDMAASGSEALEKVGSEKYDIVILDMMMPGRDGMDVLIELRKVRPRTRVIMITAFATVENAVTSIKKGASDYIAKPFKIVELITTVKRTIEEIRFENSVKKLNIEHTLNSLSNPIRRNIIHLINSRKKIRLMEIARELDIEDHTKIVFHLRLLKEVGIVEQEKDKSYFLTKEGEKSFDLLKFLENYIK
jgi:DNA-binding NtrC family response regulator